MLRFLDSCSHYTTNAQTNVKWSGTNDSTIAPVAGVSPYGKDALAGNGNPRTVYKTLDNQSTWIAGCRVVLRFAPITATNDFYIEFQDVGSPQIGVYINADGTLSVKRGASTVLGTTASALSIGVWHYIEFKATINDTTGSYEVRVDGNTTPWLSGTGANTRATANNSANSIHYIVPGGYRTYLCDFYICDTTGSRNNNFLGDVKVEAVFPDATGTYSQWASFPSGANYTCVDEVTPNGDTDFVATSGAGLIDTYNFTTLTTTSGSILGVQTLYYMKRDDAGARVVAPIIRIGSTNYSGTQINPTESYMYHTRIQETNPATSSAWIISDINDAEFGQRLDS